LDQVVGTLWKKQQQFKCRVEGGAEPSSQSTQFSSKAKESSQTNTKIFIADRLGSI
jgi:hypothetical protein